MFKVVLVCDGVPNNLGTQAAQDITEEFTHRPWQRHATCSWNGSSLVLEAESETDLDGLGLMDEFSDAISSCIKEAFDGDIIVQRVSEI
jgi:hypothetical protein